MHIPHLLAAALKAATAALALPAHGNNTHALTRRLGSWGPYTTPEECKTRHGGIFQAMCCRHGAGNMHHECNRIYFTTTPWDTEEHHASTRRKRAPTEAHPPAGEAWMGCDKDFNHAYCCRKDLNVEDADYGQFYCPVHLVSGKADQAEVKESLDEIEDADRELIEEYFPDVAEDLRKLVGL